MVKIFANLRLMVIIFPLLLLEGFFLGLTFFLQLTLKIFQFLRPTAKYFCLFTANR